LPLFGAIFLPLRISADHKLLMHSRLPLAWHDQRTVLGFA
jgi:hypothetical protein